MTGSRGFSFPNTRTRCEPVAKRVRVPGAPSANPLAHPERTEFAEAIKALRDQLTAAVERETRLTADLAADASSGRRRGSSPLEGQEVEGDERGALRAPRSREFVASLSAQLVPSFHYASE